MRGLALVLTLLTLGFSRVSAQEGPSLNEVEGLMAQGLIMEARETLENWWTTRISMASRTDRQRGIWLRGKLTVDPSMAELDFRRLILEFPGGPYSDDALVRLGLSAGLRGDLRVAQASFESLIRDYPSSPRVPEAELWIRTHRQEIAALPPVSKPPAPEPEAEAKTRVEVGDFTVQMGAFRSLERARSLADQLREAGYRPRVVRTPGNDLARVRIGRFTSREGAEAQARGLEGLGFEVTLVTDAGSEERVGESAPPDRPFPGKAPGETPGKWDAPPLPRERPRPSPAETSPRRRGGRCRCDP
jgi:hypothetical protein